MSNENAGIGDPLAMLRGMWGNLGLGLPGMVLPSFDPEELEKRIADLKTVESWLSMNLSMLQMTIKNLEMQLATLRSMKAMGQYASSAVDKVTESVKAAGDAEATAPHRTGAQAPAGAAGPEAQLWPLMFVQQLQEHLRRQADATKDSVKDSVLGSGAVIATMRKKKDKQ